MPPHPRRHRDAKGYVIPRADMLPRGVEGRVLGKGGFGVTYALTSLEAGRLFRVLVSRGTFDARSTDRPPKDARDVVVKVQTRGGDGPEEARLLRSLRANPGTARFVPRLWFSGTCGEYHYTCMELVRGRDVASVRKTRAVQRELETAVHALHVYGRVHHGDLHPPNVLITPEGKVKFIDFGMAHVIHAAPKWAPEVLTPSLDDWRSFVYSPRSRAIKNYRILRDAGDAGHAWRQRDELGLGSGKFDKAYRADFASRSRAPRSARARVRSHAT